jgi:hypothetical protein
MQNNCAYRSTITDYKTAVQLCVHTCCSDSSSSSAAMLCYAVGAVQPSALAHANVAPRHGNPKLYSVAQQATLRHAASTTALLLGAPLPQQGSASLLAVLG